MQHWHRCSLPGRDSRLPISVLTTSGAEGRCGAAAPVVEARLPGLARNPVARIGHRLVPLCAGPIGRAVLPAALLLWLCRLLRGLLWVLRLLVGVQILRCRLHKHIIAFSYVG